MSEVAIGINEFISKTTKISMVAGIAPYDYAYVFFNKHKTKLLFRTDTDYRITHGLIRQFCDEAKEGQLDMGVVLDRVKESLQSGIDNGSITEHLCSTFTKTFDLEYRDVMVEIGHNPMGEGRSGSLMESRKILFQRSICTECGKDHWSEILYNKGDNDNYDNG